MIALAASYSVIDSHTAGHPTRVILGGAPHLPGASVAAMRDAFKATHDHLRRRWLHEPAGHAAMVGLVPVPSSRADFGAFFISSYIYLDMCGHGTIGYAKTLAALGTIAAPRESFTLETPAGVVTVSLTWEADGSLGQVRIRNVPSRVGMVSLTVAVPGIGPVTAAIVYGGMWYAVVDSISIARDLSADAVADALRAGAAIKAAFTEALADIDPAHGGGSQPSVLFFQTVSRLRARQLVVLDTNKFDRSPCGTGTSARLALMDHLGNITSGETYVAENLLGVTFEARVAERVTTAEGPAIVAEIEGDAYITAYTTIVKEAADRLIDGFLCR